MRKYLLRSAIFVGSMLLSIGGQAMDPDPEGEKRRLKPLVSHSPAQIPAAQLSDIQPPEKQTCPKETSGYENATTIWDMY